MNCLVANGKGTKQQQQQNPHVYYRNANYNFCELFFSKRKEEKKEEEMKEKTQKIRS